MTNYEKHKDIFIDMLSEDKKLSNWKPCLGCPKFINPHNKKVCEQCERLNKQWLNEEAKEFDPYKLKEGDKIVMR